jgi:hypothetical protein
VRCVAGWLDAPSACADSEAYLPARQTADGMVQHGAGYVAAPVHVMRDGVLGCRILMACGGTDSKVHLYLRPPGGSFGHVAALTGHENWIRWGPRVGCVQVGVGRCWCIA